MKPKTTLVPEMFTLLDLTPGNVICKGSSCLLQSAGQIPYRMKAPQGTYKVEVWGASGGDRIGVANLAYGGRGGYSSGIINLFRDELFIYIGTRGLNGSLKGTGGWNGGGTSIFVNDNLAKDKIRYVAGGAGGGGATDISLVHDDSWKTKTPRTIASLSSRIIVAGGGGGGWGINYTQEYHTETNDGGYGGGIDGGGAGYGFTMSCNSTVCSKDLKTPNAYSGISIIGATQNTSGESLNDYSQGSIAGSFGFGGIGNKSQHNSGGGGGGGWFGGAGGSSGVNHYGTGGSGGSGYAHTLRSSLSSLNSTYFVKDAILKNGLDTNIPNPFEGISNTECNYKDGYARITLIRRLHFSIRARLSSYMPFVLQASILLFGINKQY